MTNSEVDPSLRRVTFEVKTPAAMAALLAAVGDVAMQHGISMTVGEGDNLSSPVGTSERERYNPKLVTWIKDPDDGNEYPVLTRGDFLTYAEMKGIIGAPRAINAVIRGLCNDADTKSSRGPQLGDFVRTHPGYRGPLLRADTFADFLRRIHPDHDGIDIQNYGKVAAHFFAGFAEALVTRHPE